MGPLYRMVTWYKSTLQEGKQCGGTLKRKDILTDVIYLFFLPNSTACHPARCIIFSSDHFLQGFIRIQYIFYQIFQSVIIMPSNLKKTYTMKKQTATIFTQKSANFELAPLQNKHNRWEQNLLIFDAKMLRAKGSNFVFVFVSFLLLLLIWILTLNLKWRKINIGCLNLILTLVAEILQSYATVCRGACLPASDSRT